MGAWDLDINHGGSHEHPCLCQKGSKTAEADIFIEKDGKDIKKDDLVFALNDWMATPFERPPF